MSVEVKVPELPESVADATLVAWRKKPGDHVARDETLVELETDKVVLEVPSPINGIITALHQADGDVVVSGQRIATLKEVSAQDDNVINAAHSGDEEKIITPSAKKMMRQNNVNPDDVQGSGKGGRVLKEDVHAFMQQAPSAPEKIVEPIVKSAEKNEGIEPQKATVITVVSNEEMAERIEKRVPMTRLRARIAERLMDAQHNAAILTTFNEVNMQPVVDLRHKYKDLFAKKYDVKLGFMSFFVKATIEALKRFPAVNASIDGDDIVYHGYFDMGVAVASPRGLVVPVLRNSEQMSLATIEKSIANLVDKVKNNKLEMTDMTGGTFSITNGGVFGSMLSTPIINPPQSGILGMHKIQQRAMVVDGEIIAQPMMYLALSYDHRIIDGAEAVQFLVTIKDVLEDPARILVGV
ncbi:Dihydrolipoamide succinyltransferase component (E2) of 2-oxoglutarate dehydrogenase complex [hydrothermal vent metagenome]|uniref:dihydrolipoyllysine-residue succinyltransferase n=1 Tax=hydrothermal vent metagenome TaxID=652676 RepID=A0A3B0XGN9_9ZZZZ